MKLKLTKFDAKGVTKEYGLAYVMFHHVYQLTAINAGDVFFFWLEMFLLDEVKY